MTEILAVEGLTKRFGGLNAVDGAAFEVERGSLTALIGPNGAGKTTLFNALTGFVAAEAGSVRLEGEEVFRHQPHELCRRGMVRTFQITKALTGMPVIDNLMLAAAGQPGERLGGIVLRPRAWRRREAEVRAQALELLARFGLADHADAYAGTLSGGQRKLLEMARALMTSPKLLLLDEPMAGINPTLGRRLIEHIETLRSDTGLTVLFVEHDMEVVMNHSDRVVVMAEGRVIASGTAAEVRRDRAVIDAYLGGGEQE